MAKVVTCNCHPFCMNVPQLKAKCIKNNCKELNQQSFGTKIVLVITKENRQLYNINGIVAEQQTGQKKNIRNSIASTPWPSNAPSLINTYQIIICE